MFGTSKLEIEALAEILSPVRILNGFTNTRLCWDKNGSIYMSVIFNSYTKLREIYTI